MKLLWLIPAALAAFLLVLSYNAVTAKKRARKLTEEKTHINEKNSLNMPKGLPK